MTQRKRAVQAIVIAFKLILSELVQSLQEHESQNLDDQVFISTGNHACFMLFK